MKPLIITIAILLWLTPCNKQADKPPEALDLSEEINYICQEETNES